MTIFIQLGLFWSLILLFGNKMLMTSWLSSSLFSSAVILHWQRIPAALKSLIRKGGNLTGNISKLKSSFKMRIVLFHVHQVHLRRWSKASALSVPTPFLDCPLLKSFCRETYRKVWSLMIKNLKHIWVMSLSLFRWNGGYQVWDERRKGNRSSTG